MSGESMTFCLTVDKMSYLFLYYFMKSSERNISVYPGLKMYLLLIKCLSFSINA